MEDLANNEELKELIKSELPKLVETFTTNEQFVRDNQLRVARRNENYWRNRQDIFWDDTAKDWRSLEAAADYLDDFDEGLLNRRYVNIYKAHGESIIAALSSGVPATRFLPEDTNNADDIFTAEAYSRLAGYLRKNNKAKTLVIKMLTTLYNEPFVAIYNTTVKDEKFGTYTKPVNGLLSTKERSLICSNCGEIAESNTSEPEVVDDNYEPQESENLINGMPCPACGSEIFIENQTDNVEPGIIDYQTLAKSRVVQEVYGVLNVTIPAYAKDISECPFLILTEDIATELAMELYELENPPEQNADTDDTRWARLNIDYSGDGPKGVSTLRKVWLRNWAFNKVSDKENREKLKSLFPDGCLLTFIGSDLIDVEESKLDDHWTISKNPQYRFLCGDAIGTPVIPIQDAKNDVFNLTIDTISNGVTETFVESGLLDLEKYGRKAATPGSLTETLLANNKSLSESFFQLRPANLSAEVGVFEGKLEQDAQFLSGAFPSIYGGTLEGSGGTLGEYTASRNQALQRLQLTWALICTTWAEMEFKSINHFVANTDYDVSDVSKSGSGYITNWVKRSHLKGKVTCLEPEANEVFPISWPQKKALIESLLQMKDPKIDSILSHPENITQIATIYSMGDLYIPGQDDRNKQLAEISELIQGQPQQDQMGNMIPSIPIEPDIDNGPIHIETCRAWLLSDFGQQSKRDNPAAYANVLAHLKQHQMYEQQKMMQMQSQQNIQGPPEDNPNA